MLTNLRFINRLHQSPGTRSSPERDDSDEKAKRPLSRAEFGLAARKTVVHRPSIDYVDFGEAARRSGSER